ITERKIHIRDTYVILTLLFFLSYAISLLYTENLTDGYSSVERKFLLAIFPLAIVGSATPVTANTFAKVMRFFITGIFISLFIKLFFSESQIVIRYGLDTHHTFLGIYIVFAMFYILFQLQT